MPTLGVFTKATSPDAQQPFGKILATLMRGNAELQGQQQAKKIAGDQMAAGSKMTVTLAPSPTGGPPLVTLKNAPADMLNGSQESDVQQAYDTPKKNVEKQLGSMGLGTGASQAEFLRSHGYEPHRTDFTPQDLSTVSGTYGAQREAGEGVFQAAATAVGTKIGIFNKARMATNIDRRDALRNAGAEEAIGQGIAPELAVARIDAERSGQALQFNQQYLGTRDKLLDQKNVMQFPTADEYVKASGDALASVGGLRRGDDALFRQAWQTGRVSFLNDRVKALSGEEGKTAIQAYGAEERDRFIAEQAQVDPSNLSERENQRFNRVFVGLKKDQATQDAKEARAVEDQSLQRRAADQRDRLNDELAAGRIDQRNFQQQFKTLNATVDTATKYQKEVQPYVDLDKSFATVQKLAGDKSGGSDYALLVSFVHGIDNTAAREGEVKMAQGVVDLATQAKQMLNKWRTGQLLDPSVRAQYVNASRSMRDAVKPFRDKVDKRYDAVATKFGLDKNMIGIPNGDVISLDDALSKIKGKK